MVNAQPGYESASAQEPPSTPQHRYLTPDERLQVQTLSQAGHTQVWIADYLRIL
ncbi:hypothetical protein EJ02DRAFT_460595, partial [Clathrospora elynae]